MKKIAVLAISALIVLSPAGVMARAQEAQQPDNGSQTQGTTSQGNAVQSQTATQTANQGEESQLQLSNAVKTKLEQATPSYNAKNGAAKQNLTSTGKAAESLIMLSAKLESENPDLAKKIQELAVQQVDATEKISEKIDKAEIKSSIAQFFFGADYKQIDEARKQMEQNQVRVKTLNELKTQIKNEGDSKELQNQINVLEAVNTSLQDQIERLEGGFSLLGWLFNWIN